MAGNTARVKLCSNALILLGGSPISSLTEGTIGATLAANLFENAYYALLQNHRWRFATQTADLARMSATPDTGYTYAFQTPSDMLYAIKGDSSKYEIYGTEVHCNAQTFQLDYIYKIAEDKIPAYFAQALEYELASKFAIPLTGDIDKATYYAKIFMDSIRKAKFSDSTQYPEIAVVDTPYITARY